LNSYLGEIAALGTSVCWSFTSIFFTLSGRLVGSPAVNRTRLLFALPMVSLVHWATQGELLPIHAESWRWGWMALSGVIGFVIGDALLFQAFVVIGPRLSMLLMALSPVLSTVLAWILLDEKLSAVALAGIFITVAGVAWVVTDRRNGTAMLPDAPPRTYLIGVLLGLGGALGQSGGYIASRLGLEGDFPALSGNLIRLVASNILIWGLALAARQVPGNFQKFREHPRALLIVFFGAIFGPFIGVWLSLVAVQNAPVGVASTLTSLMPIFLLPLSWFFFKERITARSIVGTILAVVGTAVLFLRP